MLNIQKMIASAEECLGWPYVSPGTNDSRGIDCSGLFVKIFRDQGASIYHGSNTIYRKYCSEKGKLTSEKQLAPGMAVFKWNANTPEKFEDGLGDFQHIGLVVSVLPLRIIHASTGTMCVTTDTKIGKWAYWGKLKDVDYGSDSATNPTPFTDTGADENAVADETTVGFITSDKVNFRYGPSTSSPRIEYLNTGDAVEVIGENGSWLKCKAYDKVGYVMSQFVSATQDNRLDEPVADEPVADEGPVDETWLPEEKSIWIHADNGGRVNIRVGNGTNYGRLTSVQSGTALPYVATAPNGWFAVKVKNAVGWVSPDFGAVGVG